MKKYVVGIRRKEGIFNEIKCFYAVFEEDCLDALHKCLDYVQAIKDAYLDLFMNYVITGDEYVKLLCSIEWKIEGEINE